MISSLVRARSSVRTADLQELRRVRTHESAYNARRREAPTRDAAGPERALYAALRVLSSKRVLEPPRGPRKFRATALVGEGRVGHDVWSRE
jgi:hypothetical protein